ncbi:MAG: DoxX family protein [Chloroflexota bacterium]|nr:DoxX family protein [Chloroflexota bacterium]
MTDLALLLLRLTVGSFMFVHGSQKLFGWFGGKGVSGAMEMLGKRGVRPEWLWGTAAALAMTGGAVATLLGFLDPIGPLCIVATMLAVVTLDRHRGFFAHRGGNEHAYLYLLTALALGLSGPGRFSLDAALGIALPVPLLFAAIALAATGLVAVHAARTARDGGTARA